MDFNAKLGYIPSKRDSRDYFFNKIAPNDIFNADILPSTFYPDKIMPVRDQGNFGMCVAFALCTIKEYQESKERKMLTNEDPVPENGYSQAWIYGNRQSGQYVGEGMEPRDAVANLVKFGVPYKSLLPITGDLPICKNAFDKSFNQLTENAKPQVIKTYAAVNWNDPNEVKAALVHTGPMLAGIKVFDNMFGYFGRSDMGVAGFDVMQPWIGVGKLSGYHAIAIIGYNEKGVIVQNSWGAWWGWGGFVLIPWGSNLVDELWAITDYIPESQPINTTTTPTISIDMNAVGDASKFKITAVGSSTVSVNGFPVVLDVAPIMVGTVINGELVERTLVPVRIVAESLGGTVSWNSEKSLIEIFKK